MQIFFVIFTKKHYFCTSKRHKSSMTYTESVDFLYSLPTFHLVGKEAYKPGLQTMHALMDALGQPHLRFPAIHVAGTNGKGSTSHLLAACLQAAGLRVGLYTSPHLVDFSERIRINGKPIPRSAVIRFVEQVEPLIHQGDIVPSFFEAATAMAFTYFAEAQVDIAVIEVGLGGRLDATNILTPILSVITNIGLDHTDLLGDTLPKIAFEKAGIIKPHVPCVIGETDPETMPVFLARAEQCHILGDGLETTDCRIFFADQHRFLARQRERVAPECELHGYYQEHNLQTAYVALKVLNSINDKFKTTPSAIADGFAHVCSLTGLRGRWETLSQKPLTICDTGHNSHGIRYVVRQLSDLLTHKPDAQLYYVWGMVQDKDYDVVSRMLDDFSAAFPNHVHFLFCQAHTKRAIPAPLSVEEAVRQAQKEATDKDIIFIGGSNYVVGEALTLFN